MLLAAALQVRDSIRHVRYRDQWSINGAAAQEQPEESKPESRPRSAPQTSLRVLHHLALLFRIAPQTTSIPRRLRVHRDVHRSFSLPTDRAAVEAPFATNIAALAAEIAGRLLLWSLWVGAIGVVVLVAGRLGRRIGFCRSAKQ